MEMNKILNYVFMQIYYKKFYIEIADSLRNALPNVILYSQRSFIFH